MLTLVWGLQSFGDRLCSAGLFFFLVVFFFYYFCLCWVLDAVFGLSLLVGSRGYFTLQWSGFSLWWLSGLQCTGLAVPQQVGSSRIGDWTHVPCIDRQILSHCAIREVLSRNFILKISGLEVVLSPGLGVTPALHAPHTCLLFIPNKLDSWFLEVTIASLERNMGVFWELIFPPIWVK